MSGQGSDAGRTILCGKPFKKYWFDKEEMNDAEIARWESMSESEKNTELHKLEKPGPEKKITQELRQEAFDNYQTTDDHGMLLVGTAQDQEGAVYYKVKNAWGDYNSYDGYFYA